VNPEKSNLLSHIQSDILNLWDSQQEKRKKRRVMVEDASVRVHSCHSPMREIEVLHDQLLHMFEQDPDLIPKDILVMTPDIETYAPYIQAVFDINSDEEKRIPFSIADQSIRRESAVADSFLAILDLEGSRFGANQVLAILESSAVQGKFSLSDRDVELIRSWVKDTRIRWGIDEKSRTELGFPAFSENTWRAGLDRLLLGYAMPGHHEKMFSGILPYDFVEGADTSVLGKFCEFAERLFFHVASLREAHSTDEWSGLLTSLLDAFFLPDETSEREMQVIRQKLNDLGNIKEIAGFDERIDINVIRWHLAQALEQEGFGFGFITGGVTFCAMLPMRSIPFKVICLVGMDNDAYPRQSTPPGFDLIARHPRPGDRSRRNDDRYLFLEAMLSARNRFYISYVGQSIQDNSVIPPSVLVNELMDYIEQGFEMPGKSILNEIIIKHRLQAFSPEYFKDDQKLFSYSVENLKASQSMLKAQQSPAPFIAEGLSDPDEEWKTVALSDLCNFFGNPARFLVEKRLGIYLEKKDSLLEEREAFELGALEQYFLEQRLLKKKLDGESLDAYLSLTRASGHLPHGTPGECVFENLRQGIELFAENIHRYVQGTKLAPVNVDLHLSDFRLVGQLETIYPERLLQCRYARVTPKDRIKIWIYHLALNTIIDCNYPQISMLAGLDPFNRREPVWVAWEYPPLKNSKEILRKLLEKYWFGLVMPLHFFPKSSWDYSFMLLEKDKPQGDALKTARNTWTGNEYARGECEDAYYQLCFRNLDPLDSEFEKTARDVFKSLLEHQKEI
jgi:exodeoxyribonuclease V gamma subunit